MTFQVKRTIIVLAASEASSHFIDELHCFIALWVLSLAGAWKRNFNFKTLFLHNVIITSAPPFYQTRSHMNYSNEFKHHDKSIDIDGQQYHQYHQSRQSHITSTRCTAHAVWIPGPGLGYARKWGGVNGQYSIRVNECS